MNDLPTVYYNWVRYNPATGQQSCAYWSSQAEASRNLPAGPPAESGGRQLAVKGFNGYVEQGNCPGPTPAGAVGCMYPCPNNSLDFGNKINCPKGQTCQNVPGKAAHRCCPNNECWAGDPVLPGNC